MTNTLTINYENLDLLVQGSDHITVNPSGEELLVQLLNLKKQVNEALELAQDRISVAMEAIDPTLTSITSDHIKITKRAFGMKYTLASVAIDQIDSRFYNNKQSFTPNSKEIDAYVRETGALPSGVSYNNRDTTVSFKLKDDYGK